MIEPKEGRQALAFRARLTDTLWREHAGSAPTRARVLRSPRLRVARAFTSPYTAVYRRRTSNPHGEWVCVADHPPTTTCSGGQQQERKRVGLGAREGGGEEEGGRGEEKSEMGCGGVK